MSSWSIWGSLPPPEGGGGGGARKSISSISTVATGAGSLSVGGMSALPAPPPSSFSRLSIAVPSPMSPHAGGGGTGGGAVAVGGSGKKAKDKEDETVTVGVRIRPPNHMEDGEPVFVPRGDRRVLELNEEGVPCKEYSFDFVFGPETPTTKVFDDLASPIVAKTLNGYNGTVFAFGQTASGKTHTLMGNPESPGITWLAVDAIFAKIRDTMHDTEFLIRMSYIEIYNEEIKDLLNTKSTEKLRVIDEKGGPTIRGIKEETVTTQEQLVELIALGESNRHYAETMMNARSSRSHVLFRMVIESRQVLQGEQASGVCSPRASWGSKKPIRSSNLYLVDLAGSERAGRKSATTLRKSAPGDGLLMKEGNAINKSLLTLGQVISRLAEGRKEHIPYRDSVLTRLLSTSLGGNAKTAMLASISPAEANRDKSQATLRYAKRVKMIKNSAKVNEITDGNSVLALMRSEIEKLRRQLEEKEAMGSSIHAAEELQHLQDERDADRQKLQQLTKLIIGARVVERAAKHNLQEGSTNDVISKERAKQIEKDLTAVALGRQRADSVFARHSSVFEQLPDEAKRIMETSGGSPLVMSITPRAMGGAGGRGGDDASATVRDDEDGHGYAEGEEELFDESSSISSAEGLRREVMDLTDELKKARAKCVSLEGELQEQRERHLQDAREAEEEINLLYQEKRDMLIKIEQLNGKQQHRKSQSSSQIKVLAAPAASELPVEGKEILLEIIERLRQDKQALEEALNKKDQELDAVIKASEEQRKDMKLWLQVLQRSDDAREHDMHELAAKLESRSTQLAEAQKACQDLQRQLEEASQKKPVAPADEGEKKTAVQEVKAVENATGNSAATAALRARVRELEQALAFSQEQQRIQAEQVDADKAQSDEALQAYRAEAGSTVEELKHELGERQACIVQQEGELEEERARVSALAKERARLVVEGEALARRHEKQRQDMVKLEETIREMKTQLHDASRQGRGWTSELQARQEDHVVLTRRLESLQQQLSLAESGRVMLQRELETLQEDMSGITRQRDHMKAKLADAEKELSTVTEEREVLDASLRATEEQLASLRKELRIERDRTDQAAEGLEMAKVSAEEAKRHNAMVSSLQQEADRALQRCRDLDKLLAAETAHVDEHRSRQKRLESECAVHRQKAETLALENHALKEQLSREHAASKARQQVVAAADEKAQAAISGRRALEAQLEEVTASCLQALNDKRATEEQMVGLEAELSLAREETEAYRVHAARSKEAMAEAEKAERLTEEVESLRKQLATMRVAMLEHQLGKGGSGAGGLVEGSEELQKALVENTRQKRMYEGIVNSLRIELAEECELRRKLQDQIKRLHGTSEKSQELSEEVEFMTIQAKRAQEKSELASSAAAQAKREEQLVKQERDAAAREALRARELLENHEKEIKHLQAGLEREKRRSARLTEECAHHEKRASDFFASANKAEAELETLRQEFKRKDLDVLLQNQSAGAASEKLSRLQHDYLTLVDAHETLQAEAEDMRLRLEEMARASREQGSLGEASKREAMTYQALSREHEQHIKVLKKALQEKELELRAVQENFSRSQDALDQARVEGVQSGSAKASEQLEDLRHELDHTLSEWGKAERARRAREEKTVQLKSALQAQVEKNTLIQTQTRLLEEQVRVLTEEVGVYRQLEVYNTTLQHEFRALRERRRKREHHSTQAKDHHQHTTKFNKAEHRRERLIDLAAWSSGETSSAKASTEDRHHHNNTALLKDFMSPPRRTSPWRSDGGGGGGGDDQHRTVPPSSSLLWPPPPPPEGASSTQAVKLARAGRLFKG